MHCGLFGKLPAKRDFISHAVPRSFLSLWEPWLEASLSESRHDLGGAAWEDAFRTAPIWRFWLGADICGSTVLGAIMPSVDAIGRYFPLTLIGMPDGGEILSSPDVDPHHAWFERVEQILLAALEPDLSLDALLQAVTQQDTGYAPTFSLPDVPEPDFDTAFGDGPPRPLPELLADCLRADQDCSLAAATFWWTAGGEHFRPIGLMRRHLPEPHAFAGMLTGHFGHASEATHETGIEPL